MGTKELDDTKKLLATIPEATYKKVQEVNVKQVTILKGVSLKSTGFTHKFVPPASLLDATMWLVQQHGQQVFKLDFTFLFGNNNGLIFEKGTYTEFDDFDD